MGNVKVVLYVVVVGVRFLVMKVWFIGLCVKGLLCFCGWWMVVLCVGCCLILCVCILCWNMILICVWL